MSHVRAVRVSVLVDQPFPFAGVCVSCADVLGLKMLQLTVDIVSVRHYYCADIREALKYKSNQI